MQGKSNMDLVNSLVLPGQGQSWVAFLLEKHQSNAEVLTVTEPNTCHSPPEANSNRATSINDQKMDNSGFQLPGLGLPVPDSSIQANKTNEPLSTHANCVSIEDYLAGSSDPETADLRPIASQKVPSEHAGDFNNACQTHRVYPRFEFQEIAPQVFRAKLEFGSYTLETEQNHSSKRDAKDALCKRGLEILGALPAPKKRTCPSDSDGSVRTTTALGNKDLYDEENYVGLIMEWTQKQHLPAPCYQEYEANCRAQQRRGLAMSGRVYAMKLTLPSIPHVFGGEDATFESKQVAKRHAAKEAVHYLRNDGRMPCQQESDRSKSRRISAASSVGEDAGSRIEAEDQYLPLGYFSTQAQVHRLAVKLGFSQPRYEFRPSSSPPPGTLPLLDSSGFLTVCAYFLDRDARLDTRLAGPVGEVENVRGKKHGKELCAEGVLKVLEQIRRERLTRELMEY